MTDMDQSRDSGAEEAGVSSSTSNTSSARLALGGADDVTMTAEAGERVLGSEIDLEEYLQGYGALQQITRLRHILSVVEQEEHHKAEEPNQEEEIHTTMGKQEKPHHHTCTHPLWGVCIMRLMELVRRHTLNTRLMRTLLQQYAHFFDQVCMHVWVCSGENRDCGCNARSRKSALVH
jgi:hypothetical protein